MCPEVVQGPKARVVLGGFNAMIAMEFMIFADSLISGGFRSRSCRKNTAGESFSAPSSLVAQMLSIDTSFSEKFFGMGRLIHTATA